MVHVEEQPSPSALLPSSQSSLIRRPSPQLDVQDSPEQFGSFWQSEEQPSNGSLLPSSHPSEPSTMPLPHSAGVQTLGWPSHFIPSSILQRSEQPSPGVRLPSSQRSLAATMPSPQRAISRQALPGAAQLKPGSTWRQSALQPSPSFLLPSSHASSLVSSPSPQPAGTVGEGFVGSTTVVLPVPPEEGWLVEPPEPGELPEPPESLPSGSPGWVLPPALQALASNPRTKPEKR